jgi:hypothetical protein
VARAIRSRTSLAAAAAPPFNWQVAAEAVTECPVERGKTVTEPGQRFKFWLKLQGPGPGSVASQCRGNHGAMVLCKILQIRLPDLQVLRF